MSAEIEMRDLVRSLAAARALHDNLVAQISDIPDGLPGYGATVGDRIAELSGEVDDQVSAAERILIRCLPGLAEAKRKEDAEARERGRIWGEQRAEQIALLRLAGDDTPEESIPFPE